MDKIDIVEQVAEAEKRIRSYIRETPLEFSPYFSQLSGNHVSLKQENLQITGSFKYRGAANFILSLSKSEQEKGFITASTGNHAAAVACILDKMGLAGTIYLPDDAAPAKIDALHSYNVDLKFSGLDCVNTEIKARKIAKKDNKIYIPPYNHPQIISGQGTIAVELVRQAKNIDAVFIPVGGGGLISGVAGYLKERNPDIEIIGCQPINSPVMYESVKSGKIIELESLPTISDGSAGGIEQDSLTFEFCNRCVDEFVLVTEDEIKNAIILMLQKHFTLIEGAAALSLAAYMKIRNRFNNKEVVLIISGKKISLDELKDILYS